ncbi:MAG TPA: hypothetical protein VF950_07090 [Planctomycetota bacterium]
MRIPLILAALALAASTARADENCGKCGTRNYETSITWEGSPSEAAQKAREKEKLVFILHVSGNFEDPKFT